MARINSKVEVRIEDGIAIVQINNPPINAGSVEVRAGLVQAFELASKEGARGAILTCAGSTFVAGSDLKEFGQPLAEPELPDVISTIENSPFPVVAALHGVALGGGLELALGCDYRIAVNCTKLGLPEVSLGIVPGAGGTQRLPKLIGIVKSLDMVCFSKRIDAEEALHAGLVDMVVAENPVGAAKQFLSGGKDKRRTIEKPVPDGSPDEIEAMASVARKRGRGRPNVEEAIRLVRLSEAGDAADGLAQERAAFQKLRVSADAFALRYLFFAERRAGVVDNLDKSDAKSIGHIGVVGGGTMGRGIAKAALASGLAATLSERDEEARNAAVAGISRDLEKLVAKNLLSSTEAAARIGRLQCVVGTRALADCDLVIEAVFEDMAVKRAVLAELEAVLAPDSIIATNTSYLDINSMSADLTRPENVLGLHFFSPADRMPLLEIVRAERTSGAALATSLALARKLGKQPVVARVAEGFIGNRIYAAYRRRAEFLVLDGASPDAVDNAVRAFGFAMGPFEVSDLSGLDIAWAMRKRLAASRDPGDRYVSIADRLCEAGRLGRKAGKGWYDYATGTAQLDPAVSAIINKERETAGVIVRDYDFETIQRQLLAAIVNEAAFVVAEGVAQRGTDIDVALVNGYGFPRWRGGPVYWAAQQDPIQLQADFTTLAEAIGHGFRKGPVQDLLGQIEKDTKAA